MYVQVPNKPHEAYMLWLSILTFFSVMNETMFNVALPEIAAFYHISPSAANWANTSFSLSFAIGTAIYGKISEHIGMKKLLLWGMLTYAFGSAAGLLLHAWYPGMLAARFLQGVGASVIPALIMLLIVKVVDSGKQGKAFGLIGSIVAFGEGLGPVIGGSVTGYIHWSVLFALPLLSLPALPFVLRTLPDEASQVRGKSIDSLGAGLFAVGILAFALFMTSYHWRFIAVSVVMFALLALHMRRAQEPFLEPALFRKGSYMARAGAGALLLGTAAGFFAMIPYMMKAVYAMPASVIGAAILFPGTVSVILFGMLGGVLADRLGHLKTLTAGVILIFGGFAIVILLAAQSPFLIAAAMVLTFGGLAFVKTVVSAGTASTLKENEAGSGMGMLNFVCFLGEGIGIAAVGGLLTKSWLSSRGIGPFINPEAAVYSNITFLFLAVVAAGAVLFASTYKRKL